MGAKKLPVTWHASGRDKEKRCHRGCRLSRQTADGETGRCVSIVSAVEALDLGGWVGPGEEWHRLSASSDMAGVVEKMVGQGVEEERETG